MEEYGRGYGIIVAALALGDLIQETSSSFLINLGLENKRYFVCIISVL